MQTHCTTQNIRNRVNPTPSLFRSNAGAMTSTSLTSEELNFIVYRYLHESGFTHASFALGYEAGINKCQIDGSLVPPGALVTFVQKGLQYIEMEANLDNVNVDADDDFSFLQPLDLITKDVKELQRIIKEKKEHAAQRTVKEKAEHQQKERGKEKDTGLERDKERQERDRERDRDKEKIEKDKEHEREKEREKHSEEHKDKDTVMVCEDKVEGGLDDNGACEEPEPMDIIPSLPVTREILSSDVTILEGHCSEVFACAWSPTGSLLASGSGDSTARIWRVSDGPCGSSMQTSDVQVLKHFKGRTNEKSKDVTTLDWNGEGTLLATGSYDGQARIWNKEGDLKNTLIKHKGPIFSLKWNKKGDYLLSGSVDKTAIVWDMKTWECKQQFEFHSAPTLDVDWRNNVSFATCSTDNMIYVCKIGESRPIKTFSGHQGEVNAIKWDPTGTLLASCSDDWTAKIWSLKQDKFVHDFKEHSKEIYTIRWSPSGPGTNNPNQQLKLASASFDSTIKLWEMELGSLLYNLTGHLQPVYSVAFSPNGEYLASGSLDQCVHLWSVKDGKIVKTYRGSGGIFEVCWNKEGNKIAACFSNNTVCVMDFRM